VEDYVRARRQIAFPPKTEQEIMQEISASPTIMSHAHTNVLLLLLTGLAINVAIIVFVYLCIRRRKKLKEAELKRLNAPPDLFPLRYQPIIREEPRGLLRSQLLTSSAPSGNYFQEGSKL
jgi:sensor c-di-GMP phosphodiesterase-like protein